MIAKFLLVGIVLALANTVFAHEEDLRSGKLKPTVGQISDEVALERARTAGLSSQRVVRREGTRIFLEGMVEGRVVELEIDAMSGHAVEVGGERRLMIGPEGVLSRPSVSGPQVPVESRKLSDPALMRGVVVDNE
jgi:hypothetical protein